MSFCDIFEQKGCSDCVSNYICLLFSPTTILLNMIKKLSLLALALLFAVAVSAQHKRRVLIEEFTNASCPPCASQNPGFNAVVSANIQYLTPIKYQTNWPGFDPMNQQTQTDVAPRVTYYGVSGVPNGRQNGILEVFPLNGYTAGAIQAAYNTLTPVTIDLEHTLSPNYDSVYINVSVTSETVLTGNLRLRVAVLEEEIIFDAPPGSTNEKDFFQVMRKMLPNSTGTATGDFSAGETKSYSFAWKLANFYDINQLNVAAFLQDDVTKEVWQSERTEPITPAIPGIGIQVPSENVFACAEGYVPTFTLTNTGAENLTSATIRYRLGIGAWTNLDWTGDLAPNESELVSMTNIAINNSGTNNVEVEVLASNLGIQTNLVGGVSTIRVTAILAAPQVLPFGNTFQSAVFPPVGWTSINAGTNGWRLATNAGANSSRSARANMYDMPAGQKAFLHTPKIDLSNATNTTTLTFDHAYAYYSAALFDYMRIEASTDCGESWETIFYKGKDDLATAPAATAAFTPNSSQWQANELDLTAYNGNAEVILRFTAESGYGNNLYVDNVNITTLVSTKELSLSSFLLAPNPARDFAEVRFGLENAQSVRLFVYAADGSLVQSQLLGDLVSGDHRVALNAAKLPSGNYRVVLQGSEGVAQTQWIVVK